MPPRTGLRQARKAVSKGADGAAEAWGSLVSAVAEAVSDPLECLGNGVQDLLGIARGGRVLGPTSDWLGGAISGGFGFLAVGLKSSLDVVSGATTGPLRLLGGALAGDVALIRAGALDVLWGLLGALVLIVGGALAFGQALIPGLHGRERRLTEEERARLRRVFRGSLPSYNVRVVEGRAGLFGLSPRPFALGNKIYLKDREASREPALLIHECVHVWQYRHVGARYAVQALAAQLSEEDAYDWAAEAGEGGADWRDFNREAQAQLLEDLYDAGELVTCGAVQRGRGAFFDADGGEACGRFRRRGVDRTDLAHRAVTQLRSPRSVRLSALWS